MLFVGGALIGTAIALILVRYLPAKPVLAAALDRMGDITPAAQVSHSKLDEKVGSWVIGRVEQLPQNRFLSVPRTDLQLVGLAETRFFYNKAFIAFLMLAFGLLFGVYSQSLGIAPFAIPGIAAIGLAILGWFVPDSLLKSQAKQARLEFVRALSVYYQLVATERGNGRPPAVAMERAASVGRAWPFRRIAQALNKAQYDRQQPWDALIELSEATAIPELGDAARIIAQAGNEGASVREALRLAGKNLDSRLRNDDRATTIKATQKVRQLTMIIAFSFVALIIFPLLLSITATQ